MRDKPWLLCQHCIDAIKSRGEIVYVGSEFSDYEPDEEKRIDKAFRHPGQDPSDEARFDEYVRGGIDVLYEKLIEGSKEPEDYVDRLFDFIDEFQERFNAEVDVPETLKMCMS